MTLPAPTQSDAGTAEGAALLRTFRERAAVRFDELNRMIEKITVESRGALRSKEAIAEFRAIIRALNDQAKLQLNAVKIGRDLATYSGPPKQQAKRSA